MVKASPTDEKALIKRLLFSLGALLVFRLGVHIPTPGVNSKALALLAEKQSGGILNVLNTFSGGALERFSILALGVMPYISASIIIQLMTVVIPALEQMQKEGGSGRQKMNRIMRTLAVILALVQGYVFATGLESIADEGAGPAVLSPGFAFRITAALLLATGTAFVMWLGEQITEKGIGNGISLIIFAGIVAGFPSALGGVIQGLRDGSLGVIAALALGVIACFVVFFVTFIEQSYRKIPISYAKRVVGKRVMQAQSSFLPLKVNMAGVIPVIFASTLLSIPFSFTLTQMSGNIWMSELQPGRWLYNVVFLTLNLFFCYFYTSITFKPDDVAENLKRQNAYIPGIRPGSETAEGLSQVAVRLTLVGGVYMNLVILIPNILSEAFAMQVFIGGTSILIVVGVALETIRQISAHMATQKYDDLIFASPTSAVEKPPGWTGVTPSPTTPSGL